MLPASWPSDIEPVSAERSAAFSSGGAAKARAFFGAREGDHGCSTMDQM